MIFYSEKKLAAQLGLTRADMLHARKTALQNGVHYELHGREIVLTQSGLGRLLEFWRANGNLPPAIGDEQLQACLVHRNGDTEPATTADPVRLKVTRVFPNPHLIEAQFDVTPQDARPQDARRVLVWVKKNRNFVPNMGITARPKAAGSTAFELVGNCPRTPGRL